MSFARAVQAEWIKFRTLRSSWLTLGLAVALMVIVGVVIGNVSAPIRGYLGAQLVVGVLGVLLVTGEYGTGMIRSTFAVVPRRPHVMGAKAAVITLAAMTLAS